MPLRRRLRHTLLAFGLMLAAFGPARALEGPVRPLRMELDGRWIGHGIAYSPYRAGQSPWGAAPTDAEILEDLRLLSPHWNLLRMYDATPSAGAVLRLIREHRLPLRLILGAWIGSENDAAGRARNRAHVDAAIRLAREHRDLVVAVNIGNETQVVWSDHRLPAAALIGYLRETRAAIPQPVTTADDFKFWITADSRPIAAEVDFVMLHFYALWNGQPLANAMAWGSAITDQVSALHHDRTVIVGETGWATSHDATRTGPGGEATLMKAETSVAAQAEYLRQHYRWVAQRRIVTLLFEAFDESWKGRGPEGSPSEAEKHWGLFNEQRRPKASLEIVREFSPMR